MADLPARVCAARLDLATHTCQIHTLARRWGSQRYGAVSVEDLEQVGWVALLECQARYHGKTGSLRAYAERRIAGAMQDELRAMDLRWRRDRSRCAVPYRLVSLHDTLLQLPQVPLPEPFLVALVVRLPPRLQQVLRLSYLEGWRLHEIAAELECTISRVSQVRTQALAMLRAWLENPASAPARRTGED